MLDFEAANDQRQMIAANDEIDRALLDHVQEILLGCNPYIAVIKQTRDLQDKAAGSEIHLTFADCGSDRRKYWPTANEVAAVFESTKVLCHQLALLLSVQDRQMRSKSCQPSIRYATHLYTHCDFCTEQKGFILAFRMQGSWLPWACNADGLLQVPLG